METETINRYFLRLAYDGTTFHGWQRQPNGISVQQRLEEAMSMMLRDQVRLTGCGRTDTGVHAADFYAHFDTATDFGPGGPEKLVFKLNNFLGGAIVIYELFRVTGTMHARFSAISRTYRYCVAREQNPFRRNFTHFIYGNLDQALMNKGASLLTQYEDFTSFSKVDTDTATNICRVTEAGWTTEGSELVFTITADRFLRNMVRAIVGTLLDLGKRKMTLEQLQHVIESADRTVAGESAPAKGLILSKVVYPPDLRK